LAINEAVLFDAGWLFFAGWSMVLLVVGFLAFGHDLVFQPQTPSKNSRGPAAP
jgi:hypothetical protein